MRNLNFFMLIALTNITFNNFCFWQKLLSQKAKLYFIYSPLLTISRQLKLTTVSDYSNKNSLFKQRADFKNPTINYNILLNQNEKKPLTQNAYHNLLYQNIKKQLDLDTENHADYLFILENKYRLYFSGNYIKIIILESNGILACTRVYLLKWPSCQIVKKYYYQNQ